jgi:PAS domain S-box-containing protein
MPNMPIERPASADTSGLLERFGFRRRDPLAAGLSGPQLFALLKALPAAVYTTDADGRITFYNDAAVRLWGYAPTLGDSQWCGSWRLSWPDGTPLPHSECPMAMALKQNRAINGMEAVAERPDGGRVPFMAFPTPLYDESGKIAGAVNMLVDISERKESEEALLRLAAIVESSDDAIVAKNLDGIITDWNTGAERIFGYATGEVIGKPVTILIPEDRQYEETQILARLQRGERIDHYETIRRRKDGRLIHVSLTVSPIKNSKGKIIGASKIARDITERKQKDEQIALLTREVEHRSKNLLATAMATVNLTTGDTPEALRASIQGRIKALADSNTLLGRSRWQGAALDAIVRQELAPYCKGDQARCRIVGEHEFLRPDAAQALAMVVHELATNAAKYGALSMCRGTVEVSWCRTDDRVNIRWIEANGPAVIAPASHGFGTRVIRKLIEGQLNGRVSFEWSESGLACTLELPLAYGSYVANLDGALD